MPLYEYECDACGRRFEVIQKFSDSHAETCKECGKGPVHRLLSSPAIQFKGSGWYVTDYSQKGKSDASPDAPAAKSDAKSDAPADASSTTKTETSKSDAASTGGKTTESKE